ncbi:unnamed protein product [Linum trigynum]
MTEMRRRSPRRRLLLAEVGGRSSLGFGEEKRKRKPGLAVGGDGLNRGGRGSGVAGSGMVEGGNWENLV